MMRKELKDPRLGFVTITSAVITRDLRNANVFVSILGDEKTQKDTLSALRSAAGWIRGEFTRRAHLRIAPELEFKQDVGLARGARIFELLNQVKAETIEHENESTKGVESDPTGE